MTLIYDYLKLAVDRDNKKTINEMSNDTIENHIVAIKNDIAEMKNISKGALIEITKNGTIFPEEYQKHSLEILTEMLKEYEAELFERF